MEGKANGTLTIRTLTAAHVDDLKTVTRGTWGASCWDLYPRYTARQQRERGLKGAGEKARRAEVVRLTKRRRAPGLVAYRGREPIGWIAIGPRFDFGRIEASAATPPVDDVAAWAIPCITVRHGHRGAGVAVAMIRAAVMYAGRFGAPAVEAYPRADSERVHDDFAFYGAAAMFRKAGFRQVRGLLSRLPKSWTPRVTMRASTAARRSGDLSSRNAELARKPGARRDRFARPRSAARRVR